MERETIINRLTSEYNYPPQGAQLVATKIETLTLEIRPLFEEWWKSGYLPDFEIEQYSVKRLMDEHGMNPVAAFLTLDWLVREPKAAAASLKKGHDKVGY